MSDAKSQDAELSPQEQVQKIIEAADKLGIEVDEAAAAQWLTAMAGTRAMPGDFAVDAEAGVFGHRISLLDFDPDVLQRYRDLAEVVRIPDGPGIETAISLSGSAAQSKVQLFPGDADFFQRINIQAPTRERACQILADAMRSKALETFQAETYELVEIKWGTFQQEVVRDGVAIKSGNSISWNAQEVKDGAFDVFTATADLMTIHWDYGCQDPGWCKLDWVIAEPERGQVVHASNMLDVTWETPDGDIVPLDGYLDPYYQEVYLEADSIPLFTKIIGHLSPGILQDYVGQLEQEVTKYSRSKPSNYGKVAKRLYNIFRLTGRWSEAAFVRELFDEPAALLYQVAAMLDTIDEAVTCGTNLDRDAMVDQADRLIRSVVRVCEGDVEERLVDSLLRLRDDLSGRRPLGQEREVLLDSSYRQVGELVDEHFRTRLFLMPEIVDYLDTLPHGPGAK